jgi:hypothetical protein
MNKTAANPVSFVVTFVWFGFVAAISFLEAPVKFTAPSLTLAVGLDVGRHVFAALNKVEMAFALASLGLLLGNRPAIRTALLLAGIVGILALQTFWLLPALDARALVYINGGTPKPSTLHVGYVIAEALKLIGLLALGICQVNQFRTAIAHHQPRTPATA